MKFSDRSQWPRGSKAWVCSRSPAEIVSLNPAGCMNVCLLWGLCVVRNWSLWGADHSSRGVLPTVLRHCVWSRNLVNEVATAWVGARRHKKKRRIFSVFHRIFFNLNLWYALDFQYFSILYIIFQYFAILYIIIQYFAILYIIFQNLASGVNYFQYFCKLFLFPYVVDLVCQINTFLSGV